MNARRAALLLAALTCSAHAAEIVSFSADHVTIRIEVGHIDLKNDPNDEHGLITHGREKKMPKVLVLANRFCGAYGKNPHEIITEHEYTGFDLTLQTQYDIIHYACTAPEGLGLF